MAILERGGVEIYYQDHGSGAPLLLTHGFSATSEMWRGQVEALASEFRVIVWDLRGHGRSGSPDSAEDYAESIAVDDRR